MTTTTENKKATPDDEHWVRTLYERYVQLYGDPIEQPITSKKDAVAEEHDQHPGP